MPDFLCKSAHRVGERQGGAIVAKLETALDAACRRVKFPIGNLGEIGCTLFARERFDAASANPDDLLIGMTVRLDMNAGPNAPP